VSRRRDFAVRRALGGGVIDVLRASLAESVVVALGGWALGLCVAYFLVRGFGALAAGSIANLQAVRLDAPVLIASFVLAIVVALLSGGAPALRAARVDPSQALKQTSARAGGETMRGALVVAQIATMLVLLITAGLLMRTVAGIVSGDRSFDSKQALALRLMLTEATRFNAVDRAPMLDRMLAEIRRLPGVISAGVGSDLPPNGSQLTMTISLVGGNRDVTLPLSYAAVTPGYLEALGLAPIAGRLLEEQDRVAAQPAVVITDLAARTFFPDRNAVGRDLPAALPRADGRRAKPRIVGVVRDVEYGGLDRTAGASIFTVWETLAPGNAHLVVRTAGRPLDMAAAVRRVVQALDPTLPVFVPQTLDEVVAGSIVDRRLRLRLAATFAALAVALAAVAIWGAVAQNVLDRRREIAVRLALGATSRAAIGLMLRGGLTLTAVGVALGMAGGIAAARAIRHLLYGVAPWDPLSFLAGTGMTIILSVAACYLPARRAASVSPSELLRES
jgi:predicted permease